MNLDEQDKKDRWYDILLLIILLLPFMAFTWIRDKIQTHK